MPKQYHLTVNEIMRQVVVSMPSDGGFAESDIQAAEERIGARLPKSYRDYLRRYGKEKINSAFNEIFAPCDIITSYEELAADVADYADPDHDDEYGQLSRMPREEWHTMTDNYVLIWSENQGVWNAGYLLRDLQDGVEEPPVYISDNDDYISFVVGWNSTENFLQAMLDSALEEVSRHEPSYLSDVKEIEAFLEQYGIDRTKLARRVNDMVCRGNCLDRDNRIFCMYYENDDPNNPFCYLTVVDV